MCHNNLTIVLTRTACNVNNIIDSLKFIQCNSFLLNPLSPCTLLQYYLNRIHPARAPPPTIHTFSFPSESIINCVEEFKHHVVRRSVVMMCQKSKETSKNDRRAGWLNEVKMFEEQTTRRTIASTTRSRPTTLSERTVL